jgi:hypothetical protein
MRYSNAACLLVNSIDAEGIRTLQEPLSRPAPTGRDAMPKTGLQSIFRSVKFKAPVSAISLAK